ncbi:MAG: nitrate reductase molybdenum cofactor assembly chaperone [Caldisphaeraceae archaeon]|nr:nitrate reductase molybdenum cofactor assembly chaperone [Caldisphaeraceae archaeon]MEB3691350.1 nitrate reductase molybdenum cofactor assembly chaperone [Caldisphaeraceae archaeon]MEB3797212.1 nitrate reductase molybdenum cofactor assembly chaperone [Caldisphaeraceae archaeon]
MNQVLLIIADLLDYPSKWLGREKEILLQDLPDGVKEFIKMASSYDPLDLEEEYVSTFDFNSKTTLNMTFYITGEEKSRASAPRRGYILLKLKELLKNKTELPSNELPDYLPSILKVLALDMNKDIANMIKEPMEILISNLSKKNSIFLPIVRQAYKEIYGEDI